MNAVSGFLRYLIVSAGCQNVRETFVIWPTGCDTSRDFSLGPRVCFIIASIFFPAAQSSKFDDKGADIHENHRSEHCKHRSREEKPRREAVSSSIASSNTTERPASHFKSAARIFDHTDATALYPAGTIPQNPFSRIYRAEPTSRLTKHLRSKRTCNDTHQSINTASSLTATSLSHTQIYQQHHVQPPTRPSKPPIIAHRPLGP